MQSYNIQNKFVISFRVLVYCLCVAIIFHSLSSQADGLPSDVKSADIKKHDNVSHAMDNKGKSKVSGSAYALSDTVLAKYQYCGKDSDCMEVINGCCQCLQGDKYVSIAKDRLEDFKNNFKCENVICPKEESNKNCMDGVLSCINHKCTYFQPDLK